MTVKDLLYKFIKQANEGDLKTSEYPKEWNDLKMKVSFGMGMAAKVPWIAFTSQEMRVSNGYYPVYLYYKELNVLVLSYGISETEVSKETWPVEVMNSSPTIEAYFDRSVSRYGNSFVFKAYSVELNNNQIVLLDNDNKELLSEKDLEADLNSILDYYKKSVDIDIKSDKGPTLHEQGLFYMEKQLEDFIIHNWESTELGKRFDLIIEDGELLSQQYRTDIGPIDILVKEKGTGKYVVIELKKNQTSDDTVGQLARYMGWVKDVKKVQDVKGIIIAGEYDRRLDYALKVVPNIEVYLYKVDFTLNEFKK